MATAREVAEKRINRDATIPNTAAGVGYSIYEAGMAIASALLALTDAIQESNETK